MCQIIKGLLEIAAVIWLLGMTVTDCCEKKVSVLNLLIFAIISVALFGTRYFMADQTDCPWILSDTFAAILIGLVFLGISVLARESIGYGDSFLILLFGIQMGSFQLIELLWISVAGLFLFALWKLKKKEFDRNTRIAFYPFLLAGYLVTLITGI